ncbi:MAG: protein kinase domain-containing protein [Bacillota bacterium]
MDLKGIILKNRYRTIELIGEGGTSFVCKAEDLDNGSFVAVKFMKEKATTRYIEDIIRFRKEVDIISRLTHPNIIRVFDTGDYEGKPYLVTELLEGESLDELIKNSHKFTPGEALEIVRQLAETLKYVHSKSIIHRDLKPGNVFLERSKGVLNVKLLDFGVSYILEFGELNGEDEVVGTFGYMSPEATGILNKRVDERSDLYSLGVILYTLLAEEPPFKGNDVNKILHQHLAFQPPELYKVKEDIPYSLNEVVMKLLLKDPDQRYQSASGLLYDIGEIAKGNYSFIPGHNDPKVKLTYNTRIVGREMEIKRAGELLEGSKSGLAGILLIGGEAGVGKTGLVDEISRIVLEQDGIFLKARCVDQKSKIPYQIFKELINEYIRYIERMEHDEFEKERERLREIVGPFGEIFIGLNPSMEKYLDRSHKIMPLEPERENQRLLMVLAEFFINLPSDTVIVYFLDDLHWADEGSLNLLKEILRGMGHEKLLIIGTYRNNEVDSDHGLCGLKDEALSKKYPLNEIELVPLDFEKLSGLITGILGEKTENKEQLTGLIHNKTGGNPLFAINLLRELVEKGAVTLKRGSWELDWDKLESIPVSGSMLEVILKRINMLSKEQMEILSKAAVIGREVEISLLYKLVKLSMDRFIETIDIFISLQLIERIKDKRRILFVHDRIREAFYQMIEEEERRKLHLEVAKAIEESEGSIDDVLFELVHHYVEAGENEKTLQYIIPAANKAKSTYANEEAVKYYITGISLLKMKKEANIEEWINCCSNLVDVYLTMGKNDDAIMVLKEILPFIPEPINKARAYRKIGIANFKKGCWKECEENLSNSLTLLGERLPVSKAEWIIRLCSELVTHVFHNIFLNGNKKDESCSHKDEDKEIIQAYLVLNWMYMLRDLSKVPCNTIRMLNLTETRLAKTKEHGLSISSYAGFLASISLFKRSQKYQLEALRLREEIGDEWGVAQCYQLSGFAYSWKGMHSESINILDKAREMFVKIGDMWELGMALSALSYGYRFTSQYKKCIDLNGKYLDVSQRINNTYGMISAYIEMSYCYVESGSFDDAKEYLDKVLELREKFKDQYLYCCSLICTGYMELERERFDEAEKYLKEAKSLNESNSFIKDYTVNAYTCLAEVLIKKLEIKYKDGKKKKGESRRVFALCKQALRKTRLWANHYGTALRCMGKYYFLIGKTGLARKYLMQSVVYTRKIDRKYELAKGLYELGIFYKAGGFDGKSRSSFNTAYMIFKEIGVKEYIAKCAAHMEIKHMEEDQNSLNTMIRLNAERRLSTILNTSRYLSSILDLDELLEKIMDSVLEHVGAQRGILYLYPEEGDRKLEVFVARNVSKEEINAEGFRGSRSIIRRVETERVPISVSDALMDENLNTESSIIINRIRSVMCAPIMSKGQMIGVIYLDNSLLGGLFSSDDLKVLDLIACQAGVSVENARLYKRLKVYSEEIERSRDEIKMWNNTLEHRVVQRTEQLERLNLEYKSLADELNDKNTELEEMIEKLKEYAQTVEELAVTKERNRFAMDVHDTLGHSMVLLIKLLEVCKMEIKNNPLKAEQKLSDAISTAREGMKELKRSIYGLVPEKLEVNKFITALNKLVEDFKMSGVNIDLSIDGIYDYRNPAYSYTLFKVCQEAMTNSVRHGKAKNITIDIKFINGRINLVISDDGEGCNNVKKGFGLTGIEERINELKGSVSVITDVNLGFKINVEIPLEV